MKRRTFTAVLCSLPLALRAQVNRPQNRPQNGQQGRPQGGGGFAANIDLPVVYEGPDVIFRKVDDHLYIGSGHVMASETLYIVEGDKRAVLIDTGTKIDGLDKIVEGITSKPYDVVLTHSHPDHAGGLAPFKEVWVAKADEDTIPQFAPGFKGKIRHLEDGQKIDLGGRVLEVVFTPGHTAGSVTFMDRANHYAFSGDAFGNGNLLLTTDCSTMIASCKKALKWMQANDIYYCFNGHFMGSNHETTKRIYDLQVICEELLAGKIEGTKGRAGIGGLDHSFRRDGLNVNYGAAQLK